MTTGWQVPAHAPADLRASVACSWTATVAGSHRLVPDGCVDVLWLDTGRVVVCGPERTAWRVTVPPGTTAVGVRLRPGVAPRVLRTSALDLADERIDLADLLGDPTARRIVERVGAAGDGQADVAMLADARRIAFVAAVRPLLHDATGPDPIEQGLAALLTDPAVPTLDVVADAIALTGRQVRRRARSSFGYPPSVLVRLLRFQRFLRAAESGRERPLAALAFESGYADQPHLSRECRAIAGATPTELLAEHAPTFPGTSDPFTTPG